MHKAQQEFCKSVKAIFPHRFKNAAVLDCGSLDINGNNRYLFEDCYYIGIDIGEGPNVDIVCPIHKFMGEDYDVIISTECFEHDRHYKESLSNILRMLKPGGLFLFTCATTGRREHGTTAYNSGSSPFTNDYYKNLTEQDIREALDLTQFRDYLFKENKDSHDLYFWGIKKG